MKKYLIGLALSGLASRMGSKARAVMPRRKKRAASGGMATFLLGAGVGAGIAYALSQKLPRR
ncbi:MAG TPA: hypothetical protein VNO14_11000 [Blastocatellia bacterium]|nr:hypothetical protein [Blastocatellia bacterium]